MRGSFDPDAQFSHPSPQGGRPHPQNLAAPLLPSMRPWVRCSDFAICLAITSSIPFICQVFFKDGTNLFVENAYISGYLLCMDGNASVLPTGDILSILLVDLQSPGIHITAMGMLAYGARFSTTKVAWKLADRLEL
jgi:hypothetical protein